jgi:hypothetical protein
MGKSTIYLGNLYATARGYFQKRSGGPSANRGRALAGWALEGLALICCEQASFDVILSSLVTPACGLPDDEAVNMGGTIAQRSA